MSVTDAAFESALRSVTRRRPISDPQLLRALIGLHTTAQPRILNASWGHGVIWRGLIPPYRPTRLDWRAELDVDLVGSWCDLGQLFGQASFDAIVWDPPHVCDGGSGIVGAGWADRYGSCAPGLRAPNIAHLFPPFLEARGWCSPRQAA